MDRTSLGDLQAVLAIARRGSFRAAAIDLDMSTTALSHAIARLEARLGIRLFNRTTRSVSLTDAGRQFADQLAPALQTIDSAFDQVRSQRDAPSGLLRINVAPVAGRQIIASLVLEFLRRYPRMQVDVVTEPRLVDIVAEGFDMGIRPAHLVPSDMIALAIGPPQRHAVVAAPGYLAARDWPRVPADLMSMDCIRVRLPNGALLRWPFERQGETVLIEAPGRLTLGEADLARAAVLSGFGIGFFLEPDVSDDIAQGRMIRLLEDWTPPLPGLSLYYPGRRNPSAGQRAFLTLAREVAGGR